MRKAYWYFLFGLIILVFAVEYDLAKRTTRAVATSSKESTPGSKSTIATAKKIAEAQKNEQPKTFTEKFNEVSDEISQVQANPEKTEQKIQVLASTMSGSDLNKLSSVIVDKNLEGDQRAMAVELLSRHHSVNRQNCYCA